MHTIVVGGGIVGVSCAYSLRQRGVDVTLLEKSSLGAGATGMGGGIRTQFSTRANVKLSVASLDVWNDFESEFGVGIRHRNLGYLTLARRASTAERLREDVETQRSLGVPNRYLSPTDVTEQCPGLKGDNFVGVGYSKDDVFVDANLALQGYAERARELGVEIRTGITVTDIARRSSDGHVTGVRTGTGETLAGDAVVNAAGAWGQEVAELAGVALPVTPVLRRQLLVEPDGQFPPRHPLTMDLDSGYVFYPEDEKTMIVSGQVGPLREVDPDAYQTNIDIEWMTTVLEGVGELATYFGPDTRPKDRIAGVYAVTPDNNPIIEETAPGFVNAIGFSGHGFMHAPATGQMVAQLVTTGEQSLVRPGTFASSRFDGQDTTERMFV